MLLQFSCSNHKSIKEKIIFSMVASGDDTNADSLRNFNNIRVVRIASIYGANGSGKSNFVNAIGFARNLVVHSLANLPNAPLAQVSHKLSSVSTPSEYEFQFVKDDVRYVYGFSMKNSEIDEEYLYYFPNSRRVKISKESG